MLEVGRGPDFSREPIHAERFRELRPKDLYRDRAVMPEITGKVDGRRAAFTELALDTIAVLQRTAKTGKDSVGQRSLHLCWGDPDPERCQPGSSAASQIDGLQPRTSRIDGNVAVIPRDLSLTR